MEKKRILTIDGLWDITELNEMELKYFKIMLSKSGILFLKSKPGIGKSATFRSIAKKVKHVPTGLNPRYIDLRLAMLDETDVGLFPKAVELDVTYENEKGVKVATKEFFLTHIVPEWAKIANEAPTIIHFEELNRAPLAVRNAALQILLEREIGFKFSFNSDVFMCATGNLGEEDGTDVEEFDSALNGRLIHMEHQMLFDKWYEYFAKEHVHSSITNFLKVHGEHYYTDVKKQNKENSKNSAYASPRSWTFLSDYITANYGKNAKLTQELLTDITLVGASFVGSANATFTRYLADILKISIDDIINRYNELKIDKVKLNRDKKSELLNSLKEIDLKKMSEKQLKNIKLFILDLSTDEAATYILKVLDDYYDMQEDDNLDKQVNGNVLRFLKDKEFSKITKLMQEKVNKEQSIDGGEAVVDDTF